MCRVASREPHRPGDDRTLRAVAVVALLGLAATALQARHGLDWEAISDPVEVEWVRVGAAVLVLLVLAQLARPLLRRLRRKRRGGGRRADGDDGPEGEPLPWWLRVLAVLLVLAGLYTAWLLVGALLPDVQHSEPATRTSDPVGDAGQPIDVRGSFTPLLIAGAVLLAVAVAGRVAAAHRATTRRQDEAEDDTDEATRLEAAVVAAQEVLAAHVDPRAAIVAAYAAMAASLSAGLARMGQPGSAARPSDTPTELLTRAVRSGLVSPGPATSLTELFREARFSRHPMGETERRAAEAALALVRAELSGASRAGGTRGVLGETHA